jgi:glucose/mannose-6-phosphate isomerase
MESLGFTPNLIGDVNEAVDVLTNLERRCHRDVVTASNPAKGLALAMRGHLAAIYGGSTLSATAARRFKNDLNENAKLPAIAGALPEACHNDLEAWGHWSPTSQWPFVGVFLRDTDEHPRVAKRFEILREVLAGRLETVTVQASGESNLARLLSLVGMCQLTSVYAALVAGKDPGPIEVLEGFKEKLTQDAP